MDDNSVDTKVGRWPRKRVINKKDNVRVIGGQPGKQSGNSLRKHELGERTRRQLDSVLDELEMYKQAHRNLAGFLEALVRMHGPQSISIELLEMHCRHGNVVISADAAGRCITIDLKAPPEPEQLPPMPDTAPKPSSLTLLREGQNFRDGRVVQEHGEYFAEVVDKLPDLA